MPVEGREGGRRLEIFFGKKDIRKRGLEGNRVAYPLGLGVFVGMEVEE